MSLGGQDLPSPPPSPSHNPLQDVFNDHIDSGTKDSSFHPSSTAKVQRVHFTNGYRDGISTAKGTHVQDGFDQGYPLGAELALRVGVILGAFEELSVAVERYIKQSKTGTDGKNSAGCLPAVRSSKEGPQRVVSGQVDSEWTRQCEELQISMKACNEELTLQNIFGKEFFDEEGVWTWNTESTLNTSRSAPHSGGEDTGKSTEDEDKHRTQDSEITFREVADAHPLVIRWRANVATWMNKYGLDSTDLTWSEDSAQETDGHTQRHLETRIDAEASS